MVVVRYYYTDILSTMNFSVEDHKGLHSRRDEGVAGSQSISQRTTTVK